MRLYQKSLICLFVFVFCTIVVYVLSESRDYISTYKYKHSKEDDNKTSQGQSLPSPLNGPSDGHRSNYIAAGGFPDNTYNVWCIFTKVHSNTPLKSKLKTFLTSLLNNSKAKLRLNLVSDNSSLPIARDLLQSVIHLTRKPLDVVYYDVIECASEIEDIVSAMKPHFSSQPGTYYSDSLFYLSLGLHRLAKDQSRAVLFDADIKLQADVGEIFKEFDRFGPESLFGLAPELTPVYRHVLYSYRSQNPHTRFGNPPTDGSGVPGLNSGVVLLDLDRMRQSEKYRDALRAQAVDELTKKYSFKGHLGDQDFYTLLSMDSPSLVHVLPCAWNRQLCTWWRDHGYKDVFERFHRCPPPIRAYHGNCNTQIPDA